ncbi:alanine racemase [Actinomadura darangshiensis]|uniref:Alanine racemase n=1 Tax=Actinomadura darangshiensis TaxID=705336 RepID=A0A4R5A4J1_9ACTN|nr:alanine racemase [Actinomadura darangshiensis]TDD65594.1 alanine racemase [Actinomadura darangshiensis]
MDHSRALRRRAVANDPSSAAKARVLAAVTRFVAVLLVPIAFCRAPGRARFLACQWALSLRFPAEDLRGLAPQTLAAFTHARAEAFWRDGQLIGLTSGHRDAAEQQQIFAAEVRRSGSVPAARRRVLPPEESRHVQGLALDVRPTEGARWLERHGGRYGLYRVYDNEWWHFEYRTAEPVRLPHPDAPRARVPGVIERRSTTLRPTLLTLPAAVTANVAEIRARTRGTVMAVVKADGYGHGAVAVARAAVAAGAGWLGTTSVAEASALRTAGLAVPILTWLHPSGIDAEAAAAAGVDVAVGSVDDLGGLLAQRAPLVRVHLHMDTGMSRGGCPRGQWAELIGLAQRGQQAGRVRVVGVMGHLALADQADPAANAPAVAAMREAQRAVRAAGLGSPLAHLAATSGAVADPATHFGMVRVGAGLVGIDPSETVEMCGASRLTAPIVHTTAAPAGTPVGYGGAYVTDRATHLSVLPLGYADGIPRERSPEAGVEIRGRRFPVAGRVSMDQIVIDTGAEYFPPGTSATVFGPDGGATPTIHDWARWAGTIPHTIVTGIGPRVKRSMANEGEHGI